MKHATGTFEVKITPEAQGDAPAGGLPTSRMGIAKTFSGGVAGTAAGTMLAAGAPKPANPRVMSRSTSSAARSTENRAASCCSIAAR